MKPKQSDKASSYTCPMHPDVHQPLPGLCPECGMNLIPEKKKEGHAQKADTHAGHHTNEFRRKFWVALILSIPVVLYAEIVPTLTGWSPPAFPGSAYASAILASIIFFYCGWIFLASAWRELRAKLPGMMTLIALAIVAAYTYSIVETLRGMTDVLYWELATLITAMLLGHWLEMRAVSGAQSALKELSKLLPDTAEVIRSGTSQRVPLSELVTGDQVLIRPGGTVPADGTITEGMSEVNESIATGESRPVHKASGDAVIAGTTNGEGALTVTITAIGEHTFLAGVMRLVSEAQASKSRLQLLSDRAALWLTIIAVVVGSTTLAGWLAAGAGAGYALQRFVAVLVITCPHALGLAVPLVASISTTKAARNGFLVKQRLALEAARNVDVVLFDKTGTLTTGTYGLTNAWPVAGLDERELIRLAASADAKSEHPVSRALVAHATNMGITLASPTDYERISGTGSRATIDGTRIEVGGAGFLSEGKYLPAELRAPVTRAADTGATITYVLRDSTIIGALGFADIIRDESRQAVRQLKDMGIRVAMVTGDADEVARWVAAELAIDEYFARVKPKEKIEKVKQLQQRGLRVAMVGDGINDAPALTQADIGIAIGAGTNVAIESAGIILVKSNPRDIASIVRLSRLTYRKMLQNLFWATGYNVLAIPLAAGVLASRGFVLQPAIAALLMSASTVIVAFNAVLLKRQRI